MYVRICMYMYMHSLVCMLLPWHIHSQYAHLFMCTLPSRLLWLVACATDYEYIRLRSVENMVCKLRITENLVHHEKVRKHL